jgi:tetratricopeptide (TPR) repeat protein
VSEPADAVAGAPTVRLPASAHSTDIAQPVSIAEPLGPGDRVGRYEVQARVGRGGMGEVYRALDPGLDRMVAIKLVHGRAAAKPEEQRALLAEAQALARLSHPNVVGVYDAGTHEGRVFLAMELVAGKTLQQWLHAGERPDWRDIVDVFVAAGRGLLAAHDAGIVHGDFKPTNVMIAADGRPRVFDFGLAQAIGAHAITERSGENHGADATVRGTPAFMAPEQMAGEPLTPASDQFSFCVALHHALWRMPPFAGETLAELRQNVRRGALQTPGEVAVPISLRRIVARGLAVDPAQRYPSMAALLVALGRVRGRRLRRMIGTAVTGVAAGAVLWILWPGGAQRCDSGSERSAAVWTAERRAAVADAIAQPGKAYAEESARRVQAGLDGWVSAWNVSYDGACTAARDGDEAGLDATMACLNDALSELDATATLLAVADESLIKRALVVSERLPDPQRCLDVGAGVELSVDAADLRERSASGRAATRAGRYDEGIAELTALLAEPRLAAYPRLRADVTLLLAEAHDFKGERAVSLPMYREGIAEAAAARYPFGEARGWIQLVRVAGAATEFDEATAALRQAELLVARLRGDAAVPREVVADLDSDLGLNAGTMEIARGDYPAACERFEAALALVEQGASGQEREAALLNNLGVAYGMRGDHAQARDDFGRAAEAQRALIGPDHPDVATTMLNEGVSMHQLGDHAGAKARILEAIAIRVAALGPDHGEVGSAYASLATAESALGNREAALELYQRALAIRERTLGIDHPSTAITRNNLGDTLLVLGRPAQALPYLEDSLAQLQRRLGPTHPTVAYPLHTLGEARMALGEPAAAVAAFEAVLSLREKQAIDPRELALTRFWLARALRASGGEAKRVRTLAEQAREVLRSGDRDSALLAEVDAWLSTP